MNDAEKLEQAEIAQLLARPGFRKLVSRWIEQSGLESSGFDENPYHAAFVAGRRSLAASIRDDLITAAPDLYVKLLAEKYNG